MESFCGSSYHASCSDKERIFVLVIKYNPLIRNALPSDLYLGSVIPTGYEVVTDIYHDFTLQISLALGLTAKITRNIFDHPQKRH
jgi:hypothetical protein